MTRIAIGLVGCGGMGRRHLNAYGALARVGACQFDLAAVCDPRPDAAEDAATIVEGLFGERPAVFSRHDELFASGLVEAVDVVTDPSVHHLVASLALTSGVHVICEKPLGITVRACRMILDAASSSGAVLGVAENYRRDGPNRLARAVLDRGLLGKVHLMVETNVGGDDKVIISPWRHRRESGSIALDMGVHFTDIFAYYHGELETVFGSAFVAEPLRSLPSGAPPISGIEEVTPGVMRATGEDSLVALYETTSGVLIQLSYLPSGPGYRRIERTVHGRRGHMSVPPDRSGGLVVVQLGDAELSGRELRRELGDFELEGVAALFFGPEGTEYDLPFADVDAATIGIELADFAVAVLNRHSPEVDGAAGLRAVAGVWAIAESKAARAAVRINDVVDGTICTAQRPIDAALGLIGEEKD